MSHLCARIASRLTPRKSLGFLFVLLLAASASGGCDISTSEDEDASKRSTDCLTWQDSMCDFLVDRCNLVTSRTDCDTDYRARFCKDDTVVESCLDALGSASCTALPDICASVTNTQPAIDECNSIVALFCQLQETCTIMSQSECIAQVAVSLDCSKAIGVTSGATSCESAIKATACENATVLPTACNNVVHLSQ